LNFQKRNLNWETRSSFSFHGNNKMRKSHSRQVRKRNEMKFTAKDLEKKHNNMSVEKTSMVRQVKQGENYNVLEELANVKYDSKSQAFQQKTQRQIGSATFRKRLTNKKSSNNMLKAAEQEERALDSPTSKTFMNTSIANYHRINCPNQFKEKTKELINHLSKVNIINNVISPKVPTSRDGAIFALIE
jgi:hypothetical protein